MRAIPVDQDIDTSGLIRLIQTFPASRNEAMTAAYVAALLELGLVDRDDSITEIVATAIVDIRSIGVRDPMTIKDRALNAIGARRFDAA